MRTYRAVITGYKNLARERRIGILPKQIALRPSTHQHIRFLRAKLGGQIKVVKYVRFEKGEGIEKRQDDLAAEVAKLVK